MAITSIPVTKPTCSICPSSTSNSASLRIMVVSPVMVPALRADVLPLRVIVLLEHPPADLFPLVQAVAELLGHGLFIGVAEAAVDGANAVAGLDGHECSHASRSAKSL